MRIILSVFAVCSVFAFASTSLAERNKPNILFILADDLGYTDLACYGSDLYRTPNLDRLAQQGTRFTQAYAAAPVCSPTRASIMTGKYPARLHLTDWLKGHVKPHAKLRIPAWTTGLPESEMTIAEMLRPQGYVTAWLGKWHLGGGAQVHGFDAGDEDWEQNRKKDQEDPKGVFTLNKEALEFLDTHQGKPFFLAVSHYSPHGPVRSADGLRDGYQKEIDARNPRQSNAGYAAMIEALDTSIGQLLQALDDRGLAENTLVIFCSDNGGELNFTNNAPLRDGKGTLYEGGVRVPLIARWPGRIPADKVSDSVVCSVDFFPTFAALSGAALPDDVDGIDLSGALTGKGSVERAAVYWHYPHYHRGAPSSSIRRGEWKLIESYESGATELYHLALDPYEQHNLASENARKRGELLNDLRAWRTQVDAQMPVANPDYDPVTAELTEQQLKKMKDSRNAPSGD